MLFPEAEVRAMKRILAVFVVASVCGCSAGLMQAESVWTGSRVPAAAGEFMEGDEEAGRDVVAPSGSSPSLFENRQPFGEPTGDAIPTHSHVERMGQFMPERRPPMETARRPGRWGVHRDDGSEAHA